MHKPFWVGVGEKFCHVIFYSTAKDLNEQPEAVKKAHKDERKMGREGQAAVLVGQDRRACNKLGCDFLS